MTPLVATTIAVLLLVVFLVVNAFGLIVREVQHKRHMREREATVRMLIGASEALQGNLRQIEDANRAGARLDVAMRKSIGEGIELAQTLALRNQELADLVELRGAQKAEERSTLDLWVRIRDDLSAFAEKYPAYVFTQDEGAKG